MLGNPIEAAAFASFERLAEAYSNEATAVEGGELTLADQISPSRYLVRLTRIGMK